MHRAVKCYFTRDNCKGKVSHCTRLDSHDEKKGNHLVKNIQTFHIGLLRLYKLQEEISASFDIRWAILRIEKKSISLPQERTKQKAVLHPVTIWEIAYSMTRKLFKIRL